LLQASQIAAHSGVSAMASRSTRGDA
jgi:hypothetical protein